MIPVSCDPEGKLDRVPLDQIEEFQGGLKSLGKTEYAKLKQSITEKGFIVPCFAWRNGSGRWKLLDGHQRVRVIRTEGWTIDGGIPVVEIVAENERDAKEKLLAIVSRYGRVEGQGLYEFLDGTGIDLEEWTVPDLPDLDLDSWLDEFIRDPDVPPGDPEAVPEVPEEATTQRGDLWVLGDHRVLCGDATSVDDVEKLMGGEVADICFTSPPYALGSSIKLSGNKAMSGGEAPYLSHGDHADEWLDLMRKWFNAASMHCRAMLVNVQSLANNKRSLFRFINEYVDQFVDVAIWDKGHSAPHVSPAILSARFEFLLIFGDQGAKRTIPFASWHGNVSTVYEGSPQRNNDFSTIHAATMPLHFPEWVLGTLCDQSTSVIDPFLGTGTTLIAAEKQGRRCFGLEIEPKYVDVIVKRWEDYTGKTAVLEQSKAA